jgi:hypothetical protein
MTGPKQNNGRNRPVEIGSLLSGVFKEKKWRSRLELHRVFEFWTETVGPDIAAAARPSLIRGKVLWVKVSDSVWMQQLHLQKMILLEKLNRNLAGEKLTDIHFQLNSSLAIPAEPETQKKQTVTIDRKEEKEFDNIIDSLGNDELKASLKSLWVKMHLKEEGSEE